MELNPFFTASDILIFYQQYPIFTASEISPAATANETANNGHAHLRNLPYETFTSPIAIIIIPLVG